MKIDDITVFYRIWDDKRVVMKMTQGYKQKGVTEQMQQFKMVLKQKRRKEERRDKEAKKEIMKVFEESN